MDFWTSKELVAAYVNVGGTIFALLLGVCLGIVLIGRSELKRQRSSVVFAVMSYRFVLSRGWGRDDGKFEIFAALNAIPSLFGTHQNVMIAYRDLYAAVNTDAALNKDAALNSLLRSCGEIVGLPVQSLADSELNAVLVPHLAEEKTAGPDAPRKSAGSTAKS